MSLVTVDEVNEFVAEVYPTAARDGLRCEEVGEGTALARWAYDPAQLRPGAYISGPTVFAVADVALWYASFTINGLEAMSVTSEISVRFLRPAQGGDLMGRAVVNSVSRRRIVGTIELWIDGAPDRLVAVAQGSYTRP